MIIFGPSPNVRAREKKKLKFLIIEVKILPVGTNAENLTGKNNSKNHDKRHISTINQSIRFCVSFVEQIILFSVPREKCLQIHFVFKSKTKINM